MAQEYSGEPVIFLEQDVDNSLGNRKGRWWAAFDESVTTLPLAMVSSGRQITDGRSNLSAGSVHDLYRDMVEAERNRPPAAFIEAYQQRVGDRLIITAWITNQSGGPLVFYPDEATVSALVYEDSHIQLTNRFVRAAPYAYLSPGLAPGETGAFRLETEPLGQVSWERLHTVVLLDHRPEGYAGAFDMLQAAHAKPAAFSVAPDSLVFFVDDAGTVQPDSVQLRLRGVYDNWEVVTGPDWLAVSTTRGAFVDVPRFWPITGSITAGWQQGEIELVVTGPEGGTWTAEIPVRVYQGTFYQLHLPAIIR